MKNYNRLLKNEWESLPIGSLVITHLDTICIKLGKLEERYNLWIDIPKDNFMIFLGISKNKQNLQFLFNNQKLDFLQYETRDKDPFSLVI